MRLALALFVLIALPGGAPPGAVSPAAPMSVPRAVHTATALADGDVLVAGGCTSEGCELGSSEGRVAEVYDHSTGRFTRVGSLKEWRDDHVAVRLRDGRVLLAGGWGARDVLASTELYDPTTRTFARGPRLGGPRAGTTATALRDGRVLIAGGFTGNRPTTAAAELYLPRENRFLPLPPLHAPRGAHAAARLADGRVLVVGGLSRGRVVRSTEIFDPRSGRFVPGPALAVPRYKAAAATLRDGRVLVLGGSADIDGRHVYRSTELYDPRRNRFSPGPQLQRPRYKLAGSVVPLRNGDLLVAGGAAGAELFEAGRGRFRLVDGSLDGARLFLAAAPLPDGGALLVGGYDDRISPTAKTWRYR